MAFGLRVILITLHWSTAEPRAGAAAVWRLNPLATMTTMICFRGALLKKWKNSKIDITCFGSHETGVHGEFVEGQGKSSLWQVTRYKPQLQPPKSKRSKEEFHHLRRVVYGSNQESGATLGIRGAGSRQYRDIGCRLLHVYIYFEQTIFIELD